MSRKTFFVLIILAVSIISANVLMAAPKEEAELNNDDFGMVAGQIINADVVGGEKVFRSAPYLMKLLQYQEIEKEEPCE